MSEQMTFEGAVKRLEEIVRELEAGERPLAESLTLFEEGVRLSKHCQDLLAEAEGKIEKLVGGKLLDAEGFEDGAGDGGR